MAQNKEDDDFAVWEENVEVVTMFLRLQTQWHLVQGGFVGLNYQSAEFLFKIYSVANPAEMMMDLQTMELAALKVLNTPKD